MWSSQFRFVSHAAWTVHPDTGAEEPTPLREVCWWGYDTPSRSYDGVHSLLFCACKAIMVGKTHDAKAADGEDGGEKKLFGSLRNKLKQTRLYDVKIGAIHAKNQVGKLENL